MVALDYPIFGMQSADPNVQNLQDIYGTSAMPVFEWVKRIQTGTGTYDPATDAPILKQYEDLTAQHGVPEGYQTPIELKQVLGDVAKQMVGAAGGQVGAAFASPYLGGDQLTTGLKHTFSDLPSQTVQNLSSDFWKTKLAGGTKVPAGGIAGEGLLKAGQIFHPELANKSIASQTGNLELYNEIHSMSANNPKMNLASPTEGGYVYDNTALQQAKSSRAVGGNYNLSANPIDANTLKPTYFDRVGESLDWRTQAGKTNMASAAGSGIVNFGMQLAMGVKPKKAAKSAGASAIGQYIGNAILPGIGGIVGGVLGSAIGGRVICNELLRQKIMTKEQVLMDYKFTRDYLTPQHVKGYHLWAVWVVRQMRKGKMVKLWKHIATHRANEIAYIYGKRDKPDYLGKIYRKILEPVCWSVGFFAKSTDWSILYKTKEI